MQDNQTSAERASKTKKDLFTTGIKTQLDRKSLRMSGWLCANLADPRDDRKKWSFVDHEFQIEIIDSQERDVVVTKSAQCGVSTLFINYNLGFCATNDYRKALYILPTSAFAQTFSATRINPAIESSEAISALMSNDQDSSSVKRIGNCFLFMKGTTGTSAAISIDADLLTTDELDFCKMDVLGSFSSRLQHSDLKLERRFSTPTLPDFGITKLYTESSRGRYMVKHSKCNQWVAPNFFNDVVIPGFDFPLSEFTKEDRFHKGVASAFVQCPSCGHEITHENLCDATTRSWVHEFESVDRRGYKVTPFDVPKYNQIPEVLQSIEKYTLYQDWHNFRIGMPYASATNSFMIETMKEHSKGLGNGQSLTGLRSGSTYKNVFIGADLGKEGWVVVGVVDDRGGLLIVSYEKVAVVFLPGQNMGRYLESLFRKLMGVRMIVDALPNFETSLYLTARLHQGQAYGAFYGAASKSMLDIYNFNDNKGTVTMDRTASFDELASACNGGIIRFLKCADEDLLWSHLDSMKKTKVATAKGEAYSWVNSGPDHFAHALGYCYAAFASVESRESGIRISAGFSMSSVKMKVPEGPYVDGR